MSLKSEEECKFKTEIDAKGNSRAHLRGKLKMEDFLTLTTENKNFQGAKSEMLKLEGQTETQERLV